MGRKRNVGRPSKRNINARNKYWRKKRKKSVKGQQYMSYEQKNINRILKERDMYRQKYHKLMMRKQKKRERRFK